MQTPAPLVWPHAREQRKQDRRQTILAAYAHTNDPAAPDFRPLLARASRHVDLLDLTLTDALQRDHVTDLLVEKAGSDCQVRLLLSAPESIHLTVLDAELDEIAIAADTEKDLAEDTYHALMPVGPVGKPTELQLCFPILAFNFCKYPQAAKAFITFMLEKDQYEKWNANRSTVTMGAICDPIQPTMTEVAPMPREVKSPDAERNE